MPTVASCLMSLLCPVKVGGDEARIGKTDIASEHDLTPERRV